MLFKDEYPEEYTYFKTALEKELDSIGETKYREELMKVLAQLETVSAIRKCIPSRSNRTMRLRRAWSNSQRSLDRSR